jgi:hypothetical protein
VITSSEERVASLIRQAPWLLAACVVAGVASCFWVFAPPAYLLACAALGALWFAVVALGAYLRRAHRFPLSFFQVFVVIVGFIFIDDHLKAGGFFGFDVPCLPQGFNTGAAMVQGWAVGIGVGFLATLVFRRWLAAFAIAKPGRDQ